MHVPLKYAQRRKQERIEDKLGCYYSVYMAKMPKNRTRKRKQHAGRVLASGSDGCIFTEPVWPCLEHIPGYDPTDKTLVGKIVPVEDNEDTIIRIAETILGGKSKYIVELIGSCSPADSSTAVEPNKTYINANKADLLLYKSLERKKARKYLSLSTRAPTPDYSNACTNLSDISPNDLTNNYKILVIRKYSNTLINYYNTNNNTNYLIVRNILNAAVNLVKTIETFAKNPETSLINIDLHSGNIFQNFDEKGKIYLGMADFGRCMYKTPDDNSNWVKMLDNYCFQMKLHTGYPQIPLEARIYSFLAHKRYIQSSEQFITEFVADIFINNNDDINYLCNNSEVFAHFLRTNFELFIMHCIDTVKYSFNVDSIIEYIGLRFTTIGLLNVLWSVISDDEETLKEIPYIINSVDYFMKTNGDTSKFGTSLIMLFVKLYYTNLIMPYKLNPSGDPDKYLEIVKTYDFAREFEELFTIVTLRLGVTPSLSRQVGTRFLIPSQVQPQAQPQPQPQPQPQKILPLKRPYPFTRKNRRSKN